MQVAADPFKLAFLKRMLLGFHLSAVSSAALSARERAKAVKLAADAAAAAARGGSAGWARGLAEEERRKCLRGERQSAPPLRLRRCSTSWKLPRSRKILGRCLRSWSRRKTAVLSGGVLARALVTKRIQVLRKLVPGGESMDALSLLDETLDYAASLKAQVDVMRWLLKASEASNSKSVPAQQSALPMKACGSV